MSATKARVCQWIEDPVADSWDACCGGDYKCSNEDPESLFFNFCPFCGKPIVIFRVRESERKAAIDAENPDGEWRSECGLIPGRDDHCPKCDARNPKP